MSTITIVVVNYCVTAENSGPRAITNRKIQRHHDGSLSSRVSLREGYTTEADIPKILAIVHGVTPDEIDVVSVEVVR